MKILSDKEFRECRARMEVIISKGTRLGDMELLSDEEKREYTNLSSAIAVYEAEYHPLPWVVSPKITNAIREKMSERGVNQKEVAKLLGISESRISDLLGGRRRLNLNIAKKLRDNLGISADFILDYA